MTRTQRWMGALALWGALAAGPAALAAGPAVAKAVLYRDLAQAHAITEGHGPRVLYDLFDPNCPYCHLLYERLQALIGPYHVTLREIPVAYLTPTSEGKAAALLEARDPRRALAASQAHYSWKTGSSIAPKTPTPAVARALAANRKLDVAAVGFPLVPILIYKKADGTVRIINSGAPPVWALKQILASIKTTS